MLFNSYTFVFLFLPAAFWLFWHGGRSMRWRLGWLTAISYAFYSWSQFESWDDFAQSWQVWRPGGAVNLLWHWRFTLVLLFSSSVDYWAGKALARLPEDRRGSRGGLLAMSLTINLGLLAFFKYAGFFSQIAGAISQCVGGKSFPILKVALPIGISFYTFESMSYVIDIYRGIARPARSYLDYACFISFFPHLVAGPIIRYSDILHQFRDTHWTADQPDWDQVNRGLLLLTIGMGKKLLLADPIAADIGPLWDALGHNGSLGMTASWAAVLGYTFRIYFDFSGYSDMAMGLGHLFAVRLPQNFNSPYKATDPSDFWKRWHMTLSAWLRDYLYIPLGGSRRGVWRVSLNLLITMFLGGMWHGRHAETSLFIVWGIWHGTLLAGWHLLKRAGWAPRNDNSIIRWVSRQATFLLVVVGWVFFRSADVHSARHSPGSIMPALEMLRGLFAPGGRAVGGAPDVPAELLARIMVGWLWCNFLPNSVEVVDRVKLRPWHAVAAGTVMAVCILHFGAPMDFLYFRF